MSASDSMVLRRPRIEPVGLASALANTLAIFFACSAVGFPSKASPALCSALRTPSASIASFRIPCPMRKPLVDLREFPNSNTSQFLSSPPADVEATEV